MEINFNQPEIKVSEIAKVFDIKTDLRDKIKLENYSKDIYLMKMKNSIVLFKKNYNIGDVHINKNTRTSYLEYLGSNKLILLTEDKIEINYLSIETNVNPNYVKTYPTDSILINRQPNYQYFRIIPLQEDNYALFYQITPANNRRAAGEVLYNFMISQNISIQEKISRLFDFTPEQLIDASQMDAIVERCDMARKMGLSEKQICLNLWEKTKKEDPEEIKFLLDTKDYETISKEIEKKLKKSSMKYKDVSKIEQACLNML